jgi:hypothetical protein
MKKINTLLFAIALFCSVFVVMNGSTSALDGSSFKPGRIIDDSLFFDKNQMSVHDIQAFLNWQVPSCDTWGTKLTSGGQTRAQYGRSQGVPPPYICLRDYHENPVTHETNFNPSATIPSGAKSAAQIIYDSAQQYNINPKVLLVTLKKEAAENLIGDDWPWPTQYRSAMGYGCPDTAPCDAEYYGFYNQMYNAARQFRSYANYPSEYRYKAQNTNYVLYNPNSSCGGTNVYIESQATAGLYNYTPYQPNAAALNNLYGTGDSCSAYGNRNFWRMYNDWFGSTSAPLVRTLDSPTLYYSDGSSRYRAGSMSMVAEYGLGLGDVRIIPQSEMNSLPLASTPNTPDLRLMIKSNSDGDQDAGTLYLISQGKRHPVVSMEQFADFGYTVSDIGYMPYSELSRMPLTSNLSNFAKGPSGFVYNISGNLKKGIFEGSTLSRLNPSGKVSELSDFVLAKIPTANAIIDGIKVLRGEDGRLWLVDNGTWRYIASINVYRCLGLDNLGIIPYTSSQSSSQTTEENASCGITNALGEKYIANKAYKTTLQGSWGIDNTFTYNMVSDGLFNRLITRNTTDNTVFSSNGTLYVLESGGKRHIINMDSFSINGYRTEDITSSDDLLALIPEGNKKLATSMVVSDEQQRLYAIVGNNKSYIASMDIVYGYGFPTKSILKLPGSWTSGYPEVSALTNLSKTPSTSLHDNYTTWTIPAELEQHYGISGSTPSYPQEIRLGQKTTKTATRFIKAKSGANIYYLVNAVKHPVYSWTRINELGGNSGSIMEISDYSASLFTTGAPM